MEYCFAVTPEKEFKKKIDDLRYHYDRKLLRENYPYIPIFEPVRDFVNLKKIFSILFDFIRQKKRFKIFTDMIGFLETENKIFLNIADVSKIKEYYDFCLTELFSHLEEKPFFFPHILISKNHSLEETIQIYEELKDYFFSYHFFVEEFQLLEKKENVWEIYASFPA